MAYGICGCTKDQSLHQGINIHYDSSLSYNDDEYVSVFRREVFNC